MNTTARFYEIGDSHEYRNQPLARVRLSIDDTFRQLQVLAGIVDCDIFSEGVDGVPALLTRKAAVLSVAVPVIESPSTRVTLDPVREMKLATQNVVGMPNCPTEPSDCLDAMNDLIAIRQCDTQTASMLGWRAITMGIAALGTKPLAAPSSNRFSMQLPDLILQMVHETQFGLLLPQVVTAE